MTRRGFLRMAFMVSSGLALVSLPVPAFAAGPPVIDLVRNANGTFSLPAGSADLVSAPRHAMMSQASTRALSIAQAQNLSLPKANGLLTRMLRPIAAARTSMLREVLAVGLIAGLTWALSSGDIITQNGTNVDRTAKECRLAGNYPLAPSSVTSITTGMFRNSSNNIVAYSRQTVSGWKGGTVPAPSGWSWSYQRNVTGGTEVWFSRNVDQTNCKDFKFPPLPVEQIGEQIGGPENSVPEAQKTAIPDTILSQSPQITVPADGSVTNVEPAADIPSPANVGTQTSLPYPLTVGDLDTPWPASLGTDPFFRFPADTQLGGNTTPTPAPTPAPTTGTGTGTTQPYPTGDAVEPGSVEELPTFDKFSAPFAKLFDPFGAAFGGAGQCTSFQLPGSFGSIDLTSTVNMCPVIEPIAGLIATGSAAIGAYTAIDNILEA